MLTLLKVAIVTNTGGLAFERTSAFEEIFHQKRITVVKKVMFDEFADSKSMISSGYLDDLKNSARSIRFFHNFLAFCKNHTPLGVFLCQES
jgi:hypothetical protein